MKGIPLLLLGAFLSAVYPFTAKKLYFTTNTLQSGTSVKPGFDFYYIWNGIGQARNGKIYVAISNHDEAQGGGDVAVVEYNPYANTMKNAGSVVEGLAASGNVGTTCNKVHTWLTPTADGKVWLGSQYAGFGCHLMYVDPGTGKLTDYSRTQPYMILSAAPSAPVDNRPQSPPSASNGISLTGGPEFVSMAHNPLAPQYLWTAAYGDYDMQCWDLVNDTVYHYAIGHQDLRILLVAPNGDLYFKSGSTAYRLQPTGQTNIITGSTGTTASAFVYTASYDTAYTTLRGTGIIERYIFSQGKVETIADLPDGGGVNQTYRSIAISKDGNSLYILGNSGNIYEMNAVTRQYTSLGSISGLLAGSYAMASGVMDTLGNWYVAAWGNNQSYLIQISMGKGVVTQAPWPNVGVESRVVMAGSPVFSVFPSPVQSQATLIFPSEWGRAGVSIRIFDAAGRARGEKMLFQGLTGMLSFGQAPPGVYLLSAEGAGKQAVRKITLTK